LTREPRSATPIKLEKDASSVLRRLLSLLAFGVLVNYPWELMEGAWFMEVGESGIRWWHCVPSAIGDGLLMWLILLVLIMQCKSGGRPRSCPIIATLSGDQRRNSHGI
jgi:hypothetical protein